MSITHGTKKAFSEVHGQRLAENQKPVVDSDISKTGTNLVQARHEGEKRNSVWPISRELDLAPYSDTFLQLCAQVYFRNLHPLFPFLHTNTIRSSKPLLPVIAAVGILSSNSLKILAQGRQLLQLVHNTVQARFDHSVKENSGTASELLQAAVLLLCTVLVSDAQTQFRDAYKLYGIITAHAQKSGLFSARHPSKSGKNVSFRRQTHNWKTWCATEEKFRAILMLYVFDAELLITQGHETLLDHGPTKVPQASSDSLFSAASLEEWTVLYRQENTPQPSCLTAYSRLGSIGAAICEAHVNHTMTTERIHRLEKRLQDLYVDFLESPAESPSDVMGLKLLWHASFISLCTDPQVLNKALIEDVSQLDDRRQRYVREWSSSTAGQGSVLHALVIKQIMIKWPILQEPPLHFPQVVFLAGSCRILGS